MKNRVHRAGVAIVLWGWCVLIGCAPVTPVPPPPSTFVAMTTFHGVAGKWAGVLRTTPPSRRDDWVTVVIQPDGAYRFESVRTIGIMQGQGVFTLVDGKLRIENENGEASGTLYEEGSRRMLKVEAISKDRTRYSAELEPLK